MKNKVVINGGYGGFGLSDEAKRLYEKLSGSEIDENDIDRSDPILVEVVETLGEIAGGDYASLCVVEIDDIYYRITEYDGMEDVETPNSMHWSIVDTPEVRGLYPELFL